jgi:hypothetical protein
VLTKKNWALQVMCVCVYACILCYVCNVCVYVCVFVLYICLYCVGVCTFVYMCISMYMCIYRYVLYAYMQVIYRKIITVRRVRMARALFTWMVYAVKGEEREERDQLQILEENSDETQGQRGKGIGTKTETETERMREKERGKEERRVILLSSALQVDVCD